MSTEPTGKVFGDPTAVRTENRAAIGKGLLIGVGGCVIALTGIGVVFGVVFLSIFTAIGNSEATAEALKRAGASPQMQDKLGTPLTRGWFTAGSVETANGSSSAEVRIPVSGPKGIGKIHAVGYKRAGEEWVFTVLEVAIDGTGEHVNLLRPVTIRVEKPLLPASSTSNTSPP